MVISTEVEYVIEDTNGEEETRALSNLHNSFEKKGATVTGLFTEWKVGADGGGTAPSPASAPAAVPLNLMNVVTTRAVLDYLFPCHRSMSAATTPYPAVRARECAERKLGSRRMHIIQNVMPAQFMERQIVEQSVYS
jgi:hypothetical protein